jgi:L-ascorbate metabolism protein UlaG (beta-lactamase superfamily)
VDHDVEASSEVTFVGNATTLLRLGRFTVLTDPNFLHAGQRAYLGYGMWSKRRRDPAVEIDQLPVLDGVLLSHLHGDHFDRIAKRQLPRATPILTTRQAARRLHRHGFGAVEALSTWDSAEWRRADEVLRVTAVPAQHGPALVHRALPETMGSIVDLTVRGVRRLRLYITGDTVLAPGLPAQVTERFPGIDAILMHLGGTRILGMLMTMDGEQGAELLRMLPSGMALPIHYDDYPVMRSPLSDFVKAVEERGLQERIRPLARGETVSLIRTTEASFTRTTEEEKR